MQTSGVGDNIYLVDQTPSVSLDDNSGNGVITARFVTGNSVEVVLCQIGDEDPVICGGPGKFNGG